MTLKIEKVSNGYSLIHYEDEREVTEVFEERHCELEPLVRLLYSTLEYLNGYGSKHDQERIFIEIRRGDGLPLGTED